MRQATDLCLLVIPVSWGARRRSVLVVLLDDDTVLRNARQRDALVSNVGNRTGGVVDSLDAHAVLGVLDLRALNEDGFDRVVGAATYGADGEAMAAGANAACESDVCAGVDGEAVLG